jgi:hypothetical protein
MTKKRRHHYLPEFYLEGFIDSHNEPCLWVYEKGDPKIKKVSVKNIAIQKHYYSFITQEGQRDSETFENFLAFIENNAAPVFDKIRRQEILSEEERGWFAIFLSSLLTRVPNFRESIEVSAAEVIKRINVKLASNKETFKSMVRTFEKETGNKLNSSLEDLRDFILSGRYKIKVEPQFSLLMMTMINDLGPIFHKMNWTILVSDGHKFVTSDNPLFYDDPTHDPSSPYGVGLLNKSMILTFPITKESALLATWNKGKLSYSKCSNKLVRGINHRTVQSALKFVFSSEISEELNSLVQNHRDSSPRLRLISGNRIILTVK